MKDLQFCRIHVVRRIFIAQIAQSAKNGLCTHIRTVPDLYGTLVKYRQNVQVLDRARIQRLGRNWASGRGCATKIFEDQQLGMPTYMYFQTTAVLDLNSTNTGRSKYLLNLVPVLN